MLDTDGRNSCRGTLIYREAGDGLCVLTGVVRGYHKGEIEFLQFQKICNSINQIKTTPTTSLRLEPQTLSAKRQD